MCYKDHHTRSDVKKQVLYECANAQNLEPYILMVAQVFLICIYRNRPKIAVIRSQIYEELYLIFFMHFRMVYIFFYRHI